MSKEAANLKSREERRSKQSDLSRKIKKTSPHEIRADHRDKTQKYEQITERNNLRP